MHPFSCPRSIYVFGKLASNRLFVKVESTPLEIIEHYGVYEN
jgi:hypothetical protein